jgi:hypothetical protein
MNRKIKVLVVTYSVWRDDNNNGNSYSSIFKGMEDKLEIANIYFKDGMPKNKIVHRYFHISERALMKSAFNRKPVGRAFMMDDPYNTPNQEYSAAYNKARALRWDAIFLARDYSVVAGNWKTKALDDFINDFQPDLIFGNLHFIPVYDRIMTYLSKRFNIPLVVYPWDDFYSKNRKSSNLLYWIRFYIERIEIKNCVKNASLMYCITDQMRKEYKEFFNKDSHILYKGREFDGEPQLKDVKDSVHLVYMGNIGNDRWKVLGRIAEELVNINKKESGKTFFDIYTLSPHTDAIEKALNIPGVVSLHDPVDVEEVEDIRNSADILVHVEPVNERERLNYRLSFSTKLVDYFYNARCILALGGETSAMDYLRENDAAIVETDIKKFSTLIESLINDPQKIKVYGRKAWDCGKRNHQIKEIQSMLYDDFSNLILKK